MAKRAKPAVKDDASDSTDQPRLAEPWITEIDAALKREDSWRKKAAKVIERFRDERARADTNSSKINILWSNTEVLKAALYSKQAKPDVRRRFPDGKKGNSASRYAAEAIERGLIYCADIYDVDDAIESAIEDCLLPGRGVVRIEYEPTIVKDGDKEAVGRQKLTLGYVYWKDFCHGLARKWKKVPWVAFRHAKRKAEFEAQFPEAKRLKDAADYTMDDASGNTIETSENDKFVEVWEVWNEPTKERLFLARGYVNILQADPDPLELTDFFPCVRPLYSVTTNDKLIPEPEYCQYQDQAIELDQVQSRIRKLTDHLKWKGIYDGSTDGENMLSNLAGADDGEFLKYQNWKTMSDKGGIEAAVGFWPMERIAPVLQQLHMRAPQLIDEIYQITGISDIIRGSTDPRETKGAQQLKAQFGSMRMQRRQRDVQRFIRDLYRLKAEVIAEHFTSENLQEITAFNLPSREEQAQLKQQIAQQSQMPAAPPALPPSGAPPMAGAPGLLPSSGVPGAAPMSPAPVAAQPNQSPGNVVPFRPGPPMPAGSIPTLQAPPPKADPELVARAEGPSWDDVMEILRSDKIRSYRIDIETDSTILQDAETEKQSRLEFMQAMNDMLEKAYMAAVQAPMMLPLVKETFMFGVRTFKAGRALEQAAEDAFDQLTANPPAPPADKNAKPEVDPAIEAAKVEAEKAKLAIEAKKAENDHAAKMAGLQADQQHKAASLQLDAQDRAAKLDIERQKMQAEQQKHADTMSMEHQKFSHAQSTSQADQKFKTAAHNKQIITDASMPGEAGEPSSIDQIMQRMEMMAAMFAQGQQSIMVGQQQAAADTSQRIDAIVGELAKIDAEVQQVAQATEQVAQTANAIMAQDAAPVQVTRGRNGKATEVRKGNVVRKVILDRDGRVAGLQ